jgi:hypothetical protein
MMRSSPTQKLGTLKPSTENPMTALAESESGLYPAQRPNGIPSSVAISIAVSASSSVAGRRDRIRFNTGSR